MARQWRRHQLEQGVCRGEEIEERQQRRAERRNDDWAVAATAEGRNTQPLS